jgi:hypothetical protein
VLKVIVEELKNTVYSTAVTSSDTPPFYEKLPYCVLVDRLNKNKVSDEKDKNETIEELRQKLKFRDQDLEIVYRKNLYLKQQLELSEKSKDELNDEIENLKSEIEGKKLEIRDLAQDRVKAEEKLQKEKLILNNSLNQAQQAIEKLTGFKSSNADTLETRSSQAHHTARTKVEITAKGLLNYDIIQAQRIEKQYSEVLDYILDDFEQSLGQVYQKREIMLGVSGKETDDTTEAFNAEIQEVVGTFKGKIDLYLAEGALLNRHIEGLQLQSKRNEANAKLPSIDPTSDFHTRKYGVMLLVSDDGVRFEPHDANQQCVKCGDRVISCPHIEMKSVPFPIKQKYVKLKHPSLYLRSDVKSTEMIKNHQVAHRATEDENPHVTTPLLKIWKQFYAIKGAIKPPSNRSFAIERLIDMIQECYEAKWVDEEQTATEAKRKWEEIKRESPEKEDKLVIVYSRFHEFFYTLMDQRYVYKEISLKACHDIITALEKYEKQSFDVSLFALHISGLQQDTWKYVYLVKRLIHAQVKQDVMDIPTYRKVTRIIYPDREVLIVD